MKYKEMDGMDAWNNLKQKDVDHAEIFIGNGWVSCKGRCIQFSDNYVYKVCLVELGCKFRVPVPEEWIIERVSESYPIYAIEGNCETGVPDVVIQYPVGTKFKLTVLKDEQEAVQ